MLIVPTDIIDIIAWIEPRISYNCLYYLSNAFAIDLILYNEKNTP